MSQETERYQLGSKIVWREVGGEAVILDLSQSIYYSLNSSGLAVIKTLAEKADRGASRQDLLQAVLEEFNVDPETARKDLHILLNDLLTEKLIQPA